MSDLSDSSDPLATGSDDPTVTPLNVLSEMKLLKDGVYQDDNHDGVMNLGDTILFTFTVQNTGTVTITDITVFDPIVTVTGGPLASLAPGASDSTTFKARYSLTQRDLNLRVVHNIAIAAGAGFGGNSVIADSRDPSPLNTSDPDYDPACPDCTVVPLKQKSGIAIVKHALFNDINGDAIAQAGETITYSFIVSNTGDTPLHNVSIKDPLPGIIMDGGPITLLAGETDELSFTGVYTLKQSDINAGAVINQATVSGTDPSNMVVSDISDNTDKNGNNPTATLLDGCTIKVFNALSVNDDGENDIFYIAGIECYPDNTVTIYNRWGIEVYRSEGYNNKDRSFKGYSAGRVTIAPNNRLPSGTYYYILQYRKDDGSVYEKAGYMNLN
ncbi:gliding motility-associated C-terminal domain-containing protein [Flavobacterium sp. LAR06]|uniref:DUF7507 domain-containing protein n=1 Tax=Flavobacterium sp. LAR06 TaxID=3064897 RepID=UPI0035BF1A54